MSRLGMFKFLKEYNEIKNPVITQIGEQKWHFPLSMLNGLPNVHSMFTTNDFDDDVVFEVTLPNLKECPSPPAKLKELLQEGWDRLTVEKIQLIDTDQIVVDETQLNEFKQWQDAREKWRVEELVKQEVKDIYGKLYEVYSDIQKESESVELVIGDGHIRWTMDKRTLDHPVLLQRVKLEFDTKTPKFIVKSEEVKVELYTALLRSIENPNQNLISELIEEVSEKEFHIANVAENISFFQRLINVVNRQGKYVETDEIREQYPVISTRPMLFLRKKTLGYSEFINRILEMVEADEDFALPDFFENLIGNFQPPVVIDIPAPETGQNGLDNDVLLTLPANNEQLKIIKRLNRHPAVLVQGPPGTGKTHTIANLIGHLLSEGQTILVTSQTEKALSVLKEKVYTDLRNLCISLLNDKSQRKELEFAIDEISQKKEEYDPEDSRNKIKLLTERRKKIFDELKEKSLQLRDIRSKEFMDLVYANQTYAPIEVAKWISDGEEDLSYIPGRTKDDRAILPLTLLELESLYETNRHITAEEEELLEKNWPESQQVWEPNVFAKHLAELAHLENSESGATIPLPDEQLTEHIDTIRTLEKQFSGMLSYVKEMGKTLQTILCQSKENPPIQGHWNEIRQMKDRLVSLQNEAFQISTANQINIPIEWINQSASDILTEIIASEKQKPVSFFTSPASSWRSLRDGIAINNRKPKTLQEFRMIRDVLAFELQHSIICNKVNQLMISVDPTFKLTTSYFQGTLSFLQSLDQALNWFNATYVPVVLSYSQITSTSVHSSAFWSSVDMVTRCEQFLDQVRGYIHEFELNKEVNELRAYEQMLAKFTAQNEIMERLLKSVQQRDTSQYETTFTHMRNLLDKAVMMKKRKQILTTLQEHAPDWAKAIQHRVGVHSGSVLPERIEEAWKWRQLKNQITRLDSYDASDIQEQVNQLNQEIIENARELAHAKAWAALCSKITPGQNSDIQGWKDTIKKIGAGKSGRAKRFQAEARKLMAKCQNAIPVWIMPLNRVAEQFNPRNNSFDVVIIDEASQADMLALPALFLGKKVIIVGDDKQVSPEAGFTHNEDIDALSIQHIPNVPNRHLFIQTTSIYELAKRASFTSITLSEHFRCLPEIIQFSNDLSYDGKIKPLRDSSHSQDLLPLVDYRVPDGWRDDKDKVNKHEVDHIVSIICAMTQHPKYDGKTIGVISMLGREQTDLIDKKLHGILPPQEYERRRIQCGVSTQFQGDERDIILLTLVDSPNTKGGPVRVQTEEGNNDNYRKRYNVAVSRAKDQLWVVHSLNPDTDLKVDDIRMKLFTHLRNPNVGIGHIVGRGESPFEKEVLTSLLQRGYKVIPQWRVGSYRIDIVVFDGNKKIAIECDGERYHTIDNLQDDLNRQAILERLGWQFIRIRGSAYYSDKLNTINRVIKKLQDKEIYPSTNPDATGIEQPDKELVNSEIKQMAQNIRANWESGSVDQNSLFSTGQSSVEEPAPSSRPTPLSNPITRPVIPSAKPVNAPQDNQKDIVKRPLFDFRKNGPN